MKCDYCDQKSVACATKHVGELPEKPEWINTIRDLRKVVILHACPTHKHMIVGTK